MEKKKEEMKKKRDYIHGEFNPRLSFSFFGNVDPKWVLPIMVPQYPGHRPRHRADMQKTGQAGTPIPKLGTEYSKLQIMYIDQKSGFAKIDYFICYRAAIGCILL